MRRTRTDDWIQWCALCVCVCVYCPSGERGRKGRTERGKEVKRAARMELGRELGREGGNEASTDARRQGQGPSGRDTPSLPRARVSPFVFLPSAYPVFSGRTFDDYRAIIQNQVSLPFCLCVYLCICVGVCVPTLPPPLKLPHENAERCC